MGTQSVHAGAGGGGGGRQEEEAGGLSGVKKGEGGGVRGPENQTIWQHVSTGARAGVGGL